MSSRSTELLRQRVLDARKSPSDFIEFCLADPLGGRIRQAPVHRQLQTFLTNHAKAVVELPRDHGKSVQVCGRVLWELGNRPNLRVKIVCATDTLAIERGRFIRDAIVCNKFLRVVFPKLNRAFPWTPGAFTVDRETSGIGPTVAAFGIGAGSTGARADLIVCDDIVDVRCLYSRADRDRVAADFLNNLLNLLEPNGRCWNLCTPWHPDDLNSYLKRNPSFNLFRRAVGPNLEPVWPERWPTSALAARLVEIGPSAFARGYRLLPIDDGEVAIRPEWVRFWTDDLPREAFESVVLAVDPAVTAKATADASALIVVGRVAESNDLRVLEAEGVRVSTPELVDRIAEIDQRWRPEVILFEANAAFAGIRDLLRRHARFGPKVHGEPQTRNKSARIAALAVPVKNGSVRLRGFGDVGPEISQRELFVEMTTYPFTTHDDLVDAAAAGVEYLLSRPAPRVWV